MFTDLHIHTKYSDGKLSVKDTIDIAFKRNIKMISITDHDSISGVKEAIDYSKTLNINCISGIELSCRNDNSVLDFPRDISIHLLAYNIDYNCIELIKHLQKYHETRKNIIIDLINKLIENDFDIKYDDIHIIAGKQMRVQDVINHINSCLLCKEKKEKYISIALSYYEKLFYQDNSLEFAIRLIKRSGGLAVLAHAFFSYRDYDIELNSYQDILHLLDYLCDIGIDGIEAFYPKYTIEQSEFLQKEAKRRNKFITAGSDFHGTPQRKQMIDYNIESINETTNIFNKINRY